MSNPTVSVDNIIPVPPDPTITRTTYISTYYHSQRMGMYAENEYDYSSFDPLGQGVDFNISVPTTDVGVTQPSFVSDDAWDKSKLAPSCFVTSNYSVVPKIFIPTELLVENGISNESSLSNGKLSAKMKVSGTDVNLFTWEIIEVNGSSAGTDITPYASLGNWAGVQYVSFHAKDDKEPENSIHVRLENPTSPRPSSSYGGGDWNASNGSDLVGGGAFVLFLNVQQSRPATVSPSETTVASWSVNIEFGDVSLDLSSGGEMKAKIIGGDGDGMNCPISMVEGKSKGGPPQQEQADGMSPMTILVYPVWNGIVVSSGVQESRTNQFDITPVGATSVYVPKLKAASIKEMPWAAPFDPWNPPVDGVVVKGSSGELTPTTDVSVSFGDTIDVTAKNCRFDIAYLPCFFSNKAQFDQWFVETDSSGPIGYSYTRYPIYTKNGTGYDLTASTSTSSKPGPSTGTSFGYSQMNMSTTRNSRVPVECFGSILKITETNSEPVKNDNGSFVLTWVGGTPADPNPAEWWTYITNLNVTLSLDGSTGSITIDKHGLAGQTAEVIQSVGALTLMAQGGNGTVGGSIFKGLAMGIGENRTSQGATWTIPLVGLEKKMDDICLINVPFVDGEQLFEVLSLLSRYAGLVANYYACNLNILLSVSEDINVTRFDWKSGTTVRTALDEVMTDVNHHYVVMDGMIYFYELNPVNGMPYVKGTDWAGDYPSTKMVGLDQTPDFEDLRNEIAIIGMTQVNSGNSTNPSGASQIQVTALSSLTTPEIPWSKTLVEGMPGYHSKWAMLSLALKRQAQTRSYFNIGRITIPGNALIRPYDVWGGDAVIYSVSHNMDFSAKTWTTDLELMRFPTY